MVDWLKFRYKKNPTTNVSDFENEKGNGMSNQKK